MALTLTSVFWHKKISSSSSFSDNVRGELLRWWWFQGTFLTLIVLAGLGLRPRSLRMDLASKSSMLGLSSELLAAGKDSFLRFFSVFIFPKVFSIFVLVRNLILKSFWLLLLFWTFWRYRHTQIRAPLGNNFVTHCSTAPFFVQNSKPNLTYPNLP